MLQPDPTLFYSHQESNFRIIQRNFSIAISRHSISNDSVIRLQKSSFQKRPKHPCIVANSGHNNNYRMSFWFHLFKHVPCPMKTYYRPYDLHSIYFNILSLELYLKTELPVHPVSWTFFSNKNVSICLLLVSGLPNDMF